MLDCKIEQLIPFLIQGVEWEIGTSLVFSYRQQKLSIFCAIAGTLLVTILDVTFALSPILVK